MKSIRKMTRVWALVVMVAAGFATQAQAAPIISIDPTSTTVAVGGQFSIDIVVAGLSAPIGGFSLLLSFNPSIVSGVGYTVDPGGNFTSGTDWSFGFTGGAGSPLDLFFTGDPVGGQPSSFTLATVTLQGDNPGQSGLNLSVVGPGGSPLTDADGNDVGADFDNGSVCVGTQPCTAVPEPGLMALLGAAFAAYGVRRRTAR
jgi:hypothetical protein